MHFPRFLLSGALSMGLAFAPGIASAEMISISGKVTVIEGGLSIKDYFCLCVTAQGCPCMVERPDPSDPTEPGEVERGYVSEIIVPDTAFVRIADEGDGFSRVFFDSEVKLRFVDSFEVSIAELQGEIREANAADASVDIPDDDIVVMAIWGRVGRFLWKHRAKIAVAVVEAVDAVIDEVTDDDGGDSD